MRTALLKPIFTVFSTIGWFIVVYNGLWWSMEVSNGLWRSNAFGLVYVGFWVSQHTNFQLINVEGLAEEKASIFYTIN